MLNLLLEFGWLEKQVDEVTLTSTYAFSRIGGIGPRSRGASRAVARRITS
jgi:hypothetical protein